MLESEGREDWFKPKGFQSRFFSQKTQNENYHSRGKASLSVEMLFLILQRDWSIINWAPVIPKKTIRCHEWQLETSDGSANGSTHKPSTQHFTCRVPTCWTNESTKEQKIQKWIRNSSFQKTLLETSRFSTGPLIGVTGLTFWAWSLVDVFQNFPPPLVQRLRTTRVSPEMHGVHFPKENCHML